MSEDVVSGLEVADFGGVSHKGGGLGAGDVNYGNVVVGIISCVGVATRDKYGKRS